MDACGGARRDCGAPEGAVGQCHFHLDGGIPARIKDFAGMYKFDFRHYDFSFCDSPKIADRFSAIPANYRMWASSMRPPGTEESAQLVATKSLYRRMVVEAINRGCDESFFTDADEPHRLRASMIFGYWHEIIPLPVKSVFWYKPNFRLNALPSGKSAGRKNMINPEINLSRI